MKEAEKNRPKYFSSTFQKFSIANHNRLGEHYYRRSQILRLPADQIESMQSIVGTYLPPRNELDIYMAYPIFFAEAYKVQDSGLLQELCMAARLVMDYCMVLDNVLDTGISPSPAKMFLYLENYTLACSIIRKVCGEEVISVIDDYRTEMQRSILEEVRRNSLKKISSDSIEGYFSESVGKACLNKIIPEALMALAEVENPDLHNLIKKSCDSVHFAMQIQDDIRDYFSDRDAGIINYIINSHCSRMNFGSFDEYSVISGSELDTILYYQNMAINVLKSDVEEIKYVFPRDSDWCKVHSLVIKSLENSVNHFRYTLDETISQRASFLN